MNTHHIRSKWAAVGAAIAVSLGAGGIGISQATTSSGEKPVYLPIEPCRLADTRPEFQVGTRNVPLGPDETYTLSGWGAVGDCTLPTGTTALSLNVTAVNTTQDTFLTLFPAGGDLPVASHLNPAPGQGPVPNAVNIDLNGAGEFSIYNLAGTVDIVIDVVGIYDDHNHDDRYYTEDEVDTALDAKANSADVYTNSQADSRFVNVGPVRVRQGVSAMQPYFSVPATLQYRGGAARITSNGSTLISLDGPSQIDGRYYRLDSMTYCISKTSDRFVTEVSVWQEGSDDSVIDSTDRNTNGCYTVEMNGQYFEAYGVEFEIDGTAGRVDIESITTLWEVAPPIFIPPIFPVLPLNDDAKLTLEDELSGG